MNMKAHEKRWTLLELLNWTTEYFDEKGIENARLNAELLLSEVTGMERVMLYARFEKVIPEEQRNDFRRLVSRRADRCPVQYILGNTEFYGREFKVSPAVMIPRQETEQVVDKCLEKLPENCDGILAADVGTGSGAIAVTLAREKPQLRMIATDSSSDALGIAAENARRHGVEDRIRFEEGHLCEPIENLSEQGETPLYLLASNPPYIPSNEIENLQPEVKDFEPRKALDGGEDGLAAIRELLPLGAKLLTSDGWFVLEVGEGQADDVREYIRETDNLNGDNVEITKDLGGHKRVLAAQKN
ncbi:MAG: peptide chain release factor N(5)-glutamine methyltransferase [Candidatus Brocadiia bacterium]